MPIIATLDAPYEARQDCKNSIEIVSASSEVIAEIIEIGQDTLTDKEWGNVGLIVKALNALAEAGS